MLIYQDMEDGTSQGLYLLSQQSKGKGKYAFHFDLGFGNSECVTIQEKPTGNSNHINGVRCVDKSKDFQPGQSFEDYERLTVQAPDETCQCLQLINDNNNVTLKVYFFGRNLGENSLQTTFKLPADSKTFQSCHSGYYMPTESPGECDQCPKGWITNASGASSCHQCPLGKHAQNQLKSMLIMKQK